MVVDDGSTDDTKLVVASMSLPSPVKINYLYQANQGQGMARNLGIQQTNSEITVLIGDDIMVTPTFLEEHLGLHQKFSAENQAVLGLIDWHPDLPITPFRRWLTNGSGILGKYGGHQFAYEKLAGKSEADYNFFYTSNLSLKTALLKRYPFDSEFSKYGWEDIELGYRLTKKANLVIHYNPKALGYHYHQLDEKSLGPRMRMIAASAYFIDKKYPELKKVPSGQKKLIFKLISNPVSLLILKLISLVLPMQKTKDYYYYALSKKYFLIGLRAGRIPSNKQF